MKYGLLRAPHQNARYFEATEKLLALEVELCASALGQEITELKYQVFNGLKLLTFEVEVLEEAFERMLSRLGANMVTFEVQGDYLMPRHEYRETYFPKDMASILKYNGKTNEEFTSLMLNVCLMSGDFAKDYMKPLSFVDPMCGRGTSLYQGLMMGYHMAGIDMDKTAITEMGSYIKRYLKYHMYKHEVSNQTVHFDGKRLGTKDTVETANTIEAYKAKDRRVLQYALGDTRDINAFYKKNSFNGMVVDLPYGVQHRGRDGQGGQGGRSLDLTQILVEAAAEWHKVLKKGAAVVIAYNTHNMKRFAIDQAFEKAGFTVLSEGVYGQFEHWVEQAVNRDILVYKKK